MCVRLLGLLLLTVCLLVSRANAAEPRPNIIFILCDDLGWRDVGCFGSTFHETPNIDRLAKRGVRFTQAYAASPLCSPTRSSILTGLYPARIGITSPACHLPQVQLEKKLQAAPPNVKVLSANTLTRLKTDYVTLAEVFRESGYATAHFGKWHLGHNLPASDGDRYEPRDQGFEFDFPHTPRAAGPGGGYLAPWQFINDVAIHGKPGEHIEDRMSAEAAKYIREHKDKPFYLNYWAFSVHGPWNARRDYIEHFQAKVDQKNPQHNPLYASMVRSLDDGVGRLLTAVDEAGIADRTIIVFFSDNGGYSYLPRATDPAGFADIPATSNLPLRSGKASLYEGGSREPCVVVWPGQVQAGTTNDSLLHSTDWFPTLLTMSGLKPPANMKLDGVDQTKTLLGQGPSRDRIFCHFPHGGEAQAKAHPGSKPGTYVRQGDWKLIRFHADNDDGSDRLELYNLKDDLGESQNLAAEKPKIVRELNELITGFLRDTEAVVPIRNPNYKAEAAKPSDDKPKPKAKAAAPAEDDDPKLQGWKARGCEAVVKAGIVTISGKNNAPFLGVGAGANGPAVVKLKARCPNGGDGKIEWLTPGGDVKAAKSVPFQLQPGDWQELAIEVPAAGALGILRVYVPAQKQAVEIDWIELKSAGKPKRWEF
ncbi:MAG: sulfatase [Planctomycetales bacterium]|nr:sulfatase [Planctomycetales bacterium]